MEQSRDNPQGRYIGRPWQRWNQYPWRPTSNDEKLSAWAMRYYAQYGRRGHR